MTSCCRVCGKPLTYAGTGRRPIYCSERCKTKAKRRKRGRPETPKASLRGQPGNVTGTSP
jgi:hypothetical protein